jgi:hypothetical protein
MSQSGQTASKTPNPEHEPLLAILAILLLGALGLSAIKHSAQRVIVHDYFNPRSESRTVGMGWEG